MRDIGSVVKCGAAGQKKGSVVHLFDRTKTKCVGTKKKSHPQKMGKCVAHGDVALKGHRTKLLPP